MHLLMLQALLSLKMRIQLPLIALLVLVMILTLFTITQKMDPVAAGVMTPTMLVTLENLESRLTDGVVNKIIAGTNV